MFVKIVKYIELILRRICTNTLIHYIYAIRIICNTEEVCYLTKGSVCKHKLEFPRMARGPAII